MQILVSYWKFKHAHYIWGMSRCTCYCMRLSHAHTLFWHINTILQTIINKHLHLRFEDVWSFRRSVFRLRLSAVLNDFLKQSLGCLSSLKPWQQPPTGGVRTLRVAVLENNKLKQVLRCISIVWCVLAQRTVFFQDDLMFSSNQKPLAIHNDPFST